MFDPQKFHKDFCDQFNTIVDLNKPKTEEKNKNPEQQKQPENAPTTQ